MRTEIARNVPLKYMEQKGLPKGKFNEGDHVQYQTENGVSSGNVMDVLPCFAVYVIKDRTDKIIVRDFEKVFKY